MRLLILLLLITFSASAQTFTISGNVNVAGATVSLLPNNRAVLANDKGDFIIDHVPAGKYELRVSSIGYLTIKRAVVLTEDFKVQFVMKVLIGDLDDVLIIGMGFGPRMHDVEGTSIYAGKKTERVVLNNLVANKATNNSRQIYAKVAGLNIWENDGGAGLQLAIGGRGLSPNRTANFNTRQNGYDISADALGYPESYYTPPSEMTERIEVVRGAASLQYGTQFGGLIDFRLNQGNQFKKIELITRLTGGSWGFLNTSTSVGGTINKLNYYAFFQHKSGDGWRPNSEFNSNTGYGSAIYKLNRKASISLQYTHMDYLEHQPGGLTDADFKKDPRQSVRARNWFKVNWNLGAVAFDYKFSDKLKFNTRLFGLTAQRDALGILTFIDRADNGEADRNLYKDKYRNWGNESRLLYSYNKGTLLLGFRYYEGHTDRQQGFGNNGTSHDFTFTPALQTDTLRYSHYEFPNKNVAVFAENIFRITDKFSIIPGVRYESITTRAEGHYTNVAFDLAGNPINPQKISDNKVSRRSFVIGGIGVAYTLPHDIQTYANFSQNYKAINFNDLRTLNPNLKVDSSIQDEKGYSADIGIRKSAGRIQYDLSLFMINYNNKIGSILSVDPQSSIIYNLRTNVSRSRHIGLESYVETNIWDWLKGSKAKMAVVLFSNFSVISAKYVHSKEKVIEGNKVEFVPDVIFKTGVTLRKNKFAASYQFSYTASQFTDATNAIFTANAIDGKIPAYQVMDFSAQYEFNKIFSLYGTVNNLANKMYFTRRADSYPGPGIVPADARSLYLTLQVKL